MKKRQIYFVVLSLSIVFVYWNNRRVSDLDISPLKRFAIAYKPVLKNNGNKQKFEILCSPPLPPKDVIRVLNKSEINDDYKKYVLLIFLKLGAFEHKTYHQDFDVREELFLLKRFGDRSALTRAYCEIIGSDLRTKKIGPEFLSPYDACDYVDAHPYLKKDSLIMAEVKKIDE